MSSFYKLLRAIQFLLVAAFVIHFAGWFLETKEMLELWEQLGHSAGPRGESLSRSLFDLAYAFFYLGEAMILELLFRIWTTIQPKMFNQSESKKGS